MPNSGCYRVVYGRTGGRCALSAVDGNQRRFMGRSLTIGKKFLIKIFRGRDMRTTRASGESVRSLAVVVTQRLWALCFK